MSWAAVGAIGGIVGAVGGTVGAVGGYLGYRANRRLAKIEDRKLAILLNDHHDRHRPPQPEGIQAEVVRQTHGPDYLFGEITLPRDYRVRCEASAGPNRWPIGLDLVLRANRSYRFEIEKWPQGREQPRARELWFRFWPPAPVDDAEQWTCQCGRPVDGGGDADAGHWEWRRVPVDYYDPSASVY